MLENRIQASLERKYDFLTYTYIYRFFYLKHDFTMFKDPHPTLWTERLQSRCPGARRRDDELTRAQYPDVFEAKGVEAVLRYPPQRVEATFLSCCAQVSDHCHSCDTVLSHEGKNLPANVIFE
jgi:hypothetical protein